MLCAYSFAGSDQDFYKNHSMGQTFGKYNVTKATDHDAIYAEIVLPSGTTKTFYWFPVIVSLCATLFMFYYQTYFDCSIVMVTVIVVCIRNLKTFAVIEFVNMYIPNVLRFIEIKWHDNQQLWKLPSHVKSHAYYSSLPASSSSSTPS